MSGEERTASGLQTRPVRATLSSTANSLFKHKSACTYLSSSCFILLNLTSWVKEASVAFSGQTNGSVFALGSRDYSKAFWEDWNNWQLEGVRTMYSLYEDAQESRIRKRSTWTFSYRMRVLSESTWKATPYVAGLKTLIPTTVWQSRLILYEFHSFSLSIAGQ